MSFKLQKKSHAIVAGIFLMLIFISIDQFIKWIILHTQILGHLCNHGIAMGIVLPQVVFVALWGVIMIWVIYFWWQHIEQSFLTQLSYILILAGGISNIIDRFYYGCVIDYIPFLNISSFNFADVLISVGALIILWHNFNKS
jgi:signal peptidase II